MWTHAVGDGFAAAGDNLVHDGLGLVHVAAGARGDAGAHAAIAEEHHQQQQRAWLVRWQLAAGHTYH